MEYQEAEIVRKDVVVTGGCGFIGRHLVDLLEIQGHNVFVIDRVKPLYPSRAESIYLGDVRDRDARKIMAKADVIYHLAALRSVQLSMEAPAETFTENVATTLAVLESMSKRSHLVFAGSSSVYGLNPLGTPSCETSVLEPLSPYAGSKVACEAAIESWSRAFGLPAVVCRLFNVYGPGQSPNGPYAAVIPKFLDAARRKHPMMIYGGQQCRSFTYVADTVNALVRAARIAEAFKGYRVVNVGGSDSVSINTVAGIVAQVTGHDERRHLPVRAGEAAVTIADQTWARTMLGWEPNVALFDGIRRTWEAMQADV